MRDIGILVHGRNLTTKNWEHIIWGEPHRMGTLPRAVLEILERGPENVGLVVFGTGAKGKEGLLEAEYTKKFLLDHLEGLREFPRINTHSRYLSVEDRSLVRALLEQSICELTSQKTSEEVRAAARLFTAAKCRSVYQITTASHAPRCMLEMLKARADGAISTEELWYVAADEMLYPDSLLDDVVVAEPPHRRDDPMQGAEVQIHEVVSLMFGLVKKKDPEKLKGILKELRAKL